MPQFNPLLPSRTSTKRPPFGKWQPYFLNHFIRDTMTIQSWLAIGACIQVVLFMLPVRKIYAIMPAVSFIAWRLTDTAMMTYGLSKNTADEGVVHKKFSAIFPEKNGDFNTVGREPVTVFFLGFRINHPLGPLAPGYAKIMQYMQSMLQDLEANASTNGFLGQSFYLNAGARTTNSEILGVYYFRSVKDVHDFATGPIHRQGWDWFAKVSKQYPHLGIMHELFQSKQFETFYQNFEPTLFASTSHQVTDSDGTTKWISPVVEVKKSLLTTSAGRMGIEEMASED